MMNGNSKLNAIIKLFVANIIAGLIITAIVVVGRVWVGTEFLRNYQVETISVLALSSLYISFINFPRLLHKSKVTRVDNEVDMQTNINYTLKVLGWELDTDDSSVEIYKKKWLFGLWTEKFIVKYTESEIFFTGPKQELDAFSNAAKLPYELHSLLTVQGEING